MSKLMTPDEIKECKQALESLLLLFEPGQIMDCLHALRGEMASRKQGTGDSNPAAAAKNVKPVKIADSGC